MFFFIGFFFNDTATTEIYTLSLHDALPILGSSHYQVKNRAPTVRGQIRTVWRRFSSMKASCGVRTAEIPTAPHASTLQRSEEHTSELQSRQYLVCRLLLEKKKNKQRI